jgi:hypothetical protein
VDGTSAAAERPCGSGLAAAALHARAGAGGAAIGETDPGPGLALLSAAALTLGHALEVSNGNLHPLALWWLSVAALGCAVGLALPQRVAQEGIGEVALVAVLGAGLVLELSELLTTRPGMYVHYAPGWHLPFFRGLAAAAIVSGSLLPRARATWLKHPQVLILLGIHLWLGLWMIHASPLPHIDVYVFQRDASAALLRGEDPYALTFPNIYGSAAFYGHGLAANGRLSFGFPYPPLSLLLAIPGHVLGGDFRYSQLLATTGAAALMAYARPGRLGAVVAAVFLLTPRGLFVLEEGWTEPFVVLLLSAVVFCACRWPRALPYVFGLLLAVKQYLILAAPLALLLLPRPWSWPRVRGFAIRTAAVALAVSLPLVLWDVPAFARSAVTVHLRAPFRPEALSYLAWIAHSGGGRYSRAFPLLAATLAGALALWRAPRTPSGFAAAAALVYLAFFAFSRRAACNYYYFVLGALCLAVAAGRLAASRSPGQPASR